MKKETLIASKHRFEAVLFEEQGGAWYFSFEKKLSIRLHCFWRLCSEDELLWTSNDHKQIYGRKNPIDLQEELSTLLKGQEVTKVDRITKTGDIKIDFENGLYLEAFTDSCGFESWEIKWHDKTYIGLGKGDIARFEE
jgi:hypothetical protein